MKYLSRTHAHIHQHNTVSLSKLSWKRERFTVQKNWRMLSSLIIRFGMKQMREWEKENCFVKHSTPKMVWIRRTKKINTMTSIGFQYFGKALRKENFIDAASLFWYHKIAILNEKKILVSSSHFTTKNCFTVIKMRRNEQKGRERERNTKKKIRQLLPVSSGKRKEISNQTKRNHRPLAKLHTANTKIYTQTHAHAKLSFG